MSRSPHGAKGRRGVRRPTPTTTTPHEYGVIIRDGVLYRTRETTRNMLIVDQNGDFSVRVDRRGR